MLYIPFRLILQCSGSQSFSRMRNTYVSYFRQRNIYLSFNMKYISLSSVILLELGSYNSKSLFIGTGSSPAARYFTIRFRHNTIKKLQKPLFNTVFLQLQITLLGLNPPPLRGHPCLKVLSSKFFFQLVVEQFFL